MGRIRWFGTSLSLVVAVLSMSAAAGSPMGDPHAPRADHDRRAAVLLGTADDATPVARPEEQRGGQSFADRDVPGVPASSRPSVFGILGAPALGSGVRVDAAIVLSPRGPPPAALIHLVSP